MRVRRLLADEHAERLRQVKCPRCKSNDLHLACKNEEMPRLRHDPGEKFWICSGPEGKFCYILSSASVETIFETSEGTKPVSFEEVLKVPPPSVARIVRRRHGECIDITNIAHAAM